MPEISVIIVTWNSGKDLPRCLSCIDKQTVQDFEIIIVDNGSMDGAVDLQRNESRTFRIEKLTGNKGYAVANNIGARLAHGKWLALLNADAFPRSDWLEKLVMTAEKENGYDFFSSRQIQANQLSLVDGAGDAYHISGLAWRRCYNKPVEGNGNRSEEVFSACPTAALYLRNDFLQAGGFDEDYFSYFEDVDLGFRLRLAGKKCLYVPEAVVHHVGSASTGKRSDFSVYYGYRNMIWTFFKNMPSPLIWFFLPVHIFTVLFFILYLTFRGQGKVILRAIVDAVRGLPDMLAKRKEIQRNMTIRPLQLLEVMSTGLFEPYREFMNRNRKI
jgi:GT2 family glycosyltransferase